MLGSIYREVFWRCLCVFDLLLWFHHKIRFLFDFLLFLIQLRCLSLGGCVVQLLWDRCRWCIPSFFFVLFVVKISLTTPFLLCSEQPGKQIGEGTLLGVVFMAGGHNAGSDTRTHGAVSSLLYWWRVRTDQWPLRPNVVLEARTGNVQSSSHPCTAQGAPPAQCFDGEWPALLRFHTDQQQEQK